MPFRLFAAAASLVWLLVCPVGGQAQGTAGRLDDAAHRSVVYKAAAALQRYYVFPEVGMRAAQVIESALAAGNYDAEDAPQFAHQLTSDLQSEAHDKHVYVVASSAAQQPGRSGSAAPPIPQEQGIVRADRLQDNIGYIEIVAFPKLVLFKPAIDRAMAGLASTRALIIDLRRNHGGDPNSEVYLASYFLEGTTRITVSKMTIRIPGTDRFRTQLLSSTPTPVSFRGKPLCVLTSHSSISAGEALAYDLHSLGLAVIVGESTGGGAHAGGFVPLGHQLAIFVPTARIENPATGTNWEGGGVAADVPTPADDALRVALEKLGVSSAHQDIDDLSTAHLFEPRTPR